MKISELLDSIRKYDLVLPEFQREYVWTREQAKQLMVSLVKGYPVGGLLIWKTDQPPELKNVHKLPEKLGTVQVLLDGQQRLTDAPHAHRRCNSHPTTRRRRLRTIRGISTSICATSSSSFTSAPRCRMIPVGSA